MHLEQIVGMEERVRMTGKKTPEELLKERRERLEKAYLNKKPDRVPFSFFSSLAWAAKYTGVTTADLCFNNDAMLKASLKILTDFNVDGVDSAPLPLGALDLSLMIIALVDYPDLAVSLSTLTGPLHDILRDRYSRWPGRELPPDAEPQFLGGKFMEAEEYGKLAEDPVGFLNETVLPRVFESLSKPGSPQAYAALIRAGVELQRRSETSQRSSQEAARLGWASFPMSFSVKPLDYISDHLRHPPNMMLDIFKRPDEVLRAVDVITELTLKFQRAAIPPLVEMAQRILGTKVVMVGYPLHLNSMLSPKLYNEFYWPSLKKVLINAIDLGAVPFVFFEGDHTPHLETILELPKGKIYGMFEKGDLRKIRRVLGDHIVIGGGISTSVFAFGSREKVFEEVCRLLMDVKEPGGFIFTGTGAAIPPETKIENIWAAVEAVKKCGQY
ncbi:MAG: uroporphyrinogen decarboxylase family protein [Candidatus Bathyarchaeia archaeon]